MARAANTSTVLTVSAAFLCVGVVLAASASPTLAIVALLAPVASALILSSASARLCVVTVGALAVFQASANSPKVLYLAVATACFLLSTVSLIRSRTIVSRAAHPLVAMAILAEAYFALSFLTSRANGASTGNFAHDALPYLLLPAFTVVGIDAGQSARARTIDRAIIALALVASVGFAIDWLSRRGVSSLGINQLILSTATLPALGFALCIIRASSRSALVKKYVLFAALIAALLIVTGTRTNLALLVVIFGMVGASAKARVSIRRMSSVALGTVALAIITVLILASRIVSAPQFLGDRVASTVNFFRGNGAQDQSYQIRQQSYQLARQVFSAHRWLGAGPGHVYPTGVLTLDTPWVVPAKLGIIGVALLFGFFISAAMTIRRLRRTAGYQTIHTAMRGWFVYLVVLTPFGPWIEDKGTGLALGLGIAACVAHARQPQVCERSRSAHVSDYQRA